MVKCDNCGASIEESDNFCMNCGNKIEKNNEHDILPLVTLIKCPNCKKQILNEWKYCRFCGYDTSQPSGTSLIKKIVDDVAYNSNVLRFCTTCGKKYHDDSSICQNCGSEIPKPKENYFGDLSYENFQLLYINQILIPLSEHYNTNFRKILIKDHFNISYDEESHILYLLIEYAIRNPNENIIPYFEKILNETKENFKDIEKAVLNKVKPQIEKLFNSEGLTFKNKKQISAAEYQTIKTPITTDKHGGGTKALATFGFGLLGYAASSGVKTEVKTEKVKTQDAKYCYTTINISKKYVDIDIAVSRENNTKVILKWRNISLFSDDDYFVLDSGETFKCVLYSDEINEVITSSLLDVAVTHDSRVIHKYRPEILLKVQKFLNELINREINSSKINESSKTTVNLEKLIEMYDKGLLTDEEFITMKKKIN